MTNPTREREQPLLVQELADVLLVGAPAGDHRIG